MVNNRVPLRHLTHGDHPVILEGGKAGSIQDAKHPSPASSATPTSSDADMLGIALDALAAMFHGYISRDRALLDEGFEDLVGVLEEWRDEIPKA